MLVVISVQTVGHQAFGQVHNGNTNISISRNNSISCSLRVYFATGHPCNYLFAFSLLYLGIIIFNFHKSKQRPREFNGVCRLLGVRPGLRILFLTHVPFTLAGYFL